MTNLSGIIDKFGVYVFKSVLIKWRFENFTSWKHREITAMKDPRAMTYIQGLDEEIMTELPIFTPDILGAKEVEKPKPIFNPMNPEMNADALSNSEPSDEDKYPDEDKQLKKEWFQEDYSGLIIAMMNAARTHRWCVVEIYDRPPYWKVFTYREIKKIKYNKYDIPYAVEAKWTPKLPLAQKNSNHERSISLNRGDEKTSDFNALFVTFGNPIGKEIAINDLEAIWDLLIYIRYQNLDIVNNSAKTSGFYHIIYGDSIKPDQVAELKTAFDYTGIGQAIAAKERVIKDIKYHTPDHPEFTVEAMNESLNLLAGATRLPLSFFRGEKEGGGVFQEGFSDEAKINKKKLYVFGQFKKPIMQLVKMRWGKDVEDVVPYIKEEADEDNKFEQDAGNKFKSDNLDPNNKNEVTNKVA